MLALSFHAVFEGLAVGLEESSPDVWTMFGAIATHKFIITFCVRFNLLILINGSTKLDPVSSTVRHEVMNLCCSGSVQDSNGCYLMVMSQFKTVPVKS